MNTGAVLFNNNANSRLYAAVDAVTTSIRVLDGEGVRFPQPVGDGSNWFLVTIEDRRTDQIEICKCTGRSGDILNVTRGQEGTIAQAFDLGATVSNRLTAGTMETFFVFNGYSQVESDARYVNVAGDEMTGPLYLPLVAPLANNEAANKKYVDDVSIDEAPTDGRAYARSMIDWIPVGVGMPEAPADGTIYGRQDLTWIATVTKVDFDAALDDTATDISDLEARMSANEILDNDQGARLDGLEVTNDQQDSRLDVVESTNQDQDNRLSTIEGVNATQETAIATKVAKGGDTMGGPLALVSPPVGAKDAASKEYVDSKAGDGLGEAPTDGQSYGRKNSTWVDVTEEAPSDGLSYGRKNGGWATVVGGAYTDDAPPPPPLVDGQLWWDSAHGILYVYYQDADGFQWVQTNGGGSGGAVVFTDDLAPANPVDGQMWWRSNIGQLMVYYDDGNTKQWVQASVATFPTDYRRKTAETRNRVVNPCMQHCQEYNFASVALTNSYPADQYVMSFTSPAVCQGQIVTLATPNGGNNRLMVQVTTADTSIAAGDLTTVNQRIEGVQIADLLWGTPDAKQIVVRFGFRAPAGTWYFSLVNAAGDRSYVAAITISAGQANVDTVQTLVIPGDTSGTWPTGQVLGMAMRWTFAAGTTFQGALGWSGGNFTSGNAGSNGAGTVGNQFLIWDVGFYADPDKTGLAPNFEVPDYATELVKCMRYWQQLLIKFFGNITASTGYNAYSNALTPMRNTPTLTGTPAGSHNSFPTTPVLAVFGSLPLAVQDTRTASATGAGTFGSYVSLNARM